MVYSGIGFLLGYFVMYSIRSGSKTQDVFKSFLGAGGIAGGLLLNSPINKAKGDNIPNILEQSVLCGVGTYFLVAFCLGAVYSYSLKGDPATNPQLLPNGWNTFATILGRVLLGEDFRTPAPK